MRKAFPFDDVTVYNIFQRSQQAYAKFTRNLMRVNVVLCLRKNLLYNWCVINRQFHGNISRECSHIHHRLKQIRNYKAILSLLYNLPQRTFEKMKGIYCKNNLRLWRSVTKCGCSSTSSMGARVIKHTRISYSNKRYWIGRSWTLKPKCCHFDDFLTGNCQNENMLVDWSDGGMGELWT